MPNRPAANPPAINLSLTATPAGPLYFRAFFFGITRRITARFFGAGFRVGALRAGGWAGDRVAARCVFCDAALCPAIALSVAVLCVCVVAGGAGLCGFAFGRNRLVTRCAFLTGAGVGFGCRFGGVRPCALFTFGLTALCGFFVGVFFVGGTGLLGGTVMLMIGGPPDVSGGGCVPTTPAISDGKSESVVCRAAIWSAVASPERSGLPAANPVVSVVPAPVVSAVVAVLVPAVEAADDFERRYKPTPMAPTRPAPHAQRGSPPAFLVRAPPTSGTYHSPRIELGSNSGRLKAKAGGAFR